MSVNVAKSVTGYLDALGHAMLSVCQAIPNGVLCFFPSWGLLNAARDQWLVTGKCMKRHCCVSVCLTSCFALPVHRPLHCHGSDSTYASPLMLEILSWQLLCNSCDITVFKWQNMWLTQGCGHSCAPAKRLSVSPQMCQERCLTKPSRATGEKIHILAFMSKLRTGSSPVLQLLTTMQR